jgi:hypothetical protein
MGKADGKNFNCSFEESFFSVIPHAALRLLIGSSFDVNLLIIFLLRLRVRSKEAK